MKIKLTIPGGFLIGPDRDLVINAANIETMIANDDGGSDIVMVDGTQHTVKESVKEVIAAYTPTPQPPTPPQPPTE